MPRIAPRHLTILLGLVLSVLATAAAAGPLEEALDRALAGLDGLPLRTGVLHDRVLSLAGIERFDGTRRAAIADARRWRQLYDELRRAAVGPTRLPLARLEATVARHRRAGEVAIAIVDDRYQRMRDGAFASGALARRGEQVVPGPGYREDAAFTEARAFAAAALVDRTHRGASVRFVAPSDLHFSNAGGPPTGFAADFDDGLGWRALAFDSPVEVRYPASGTRTVRLRVRDAAGEREASFRFTVAALATPDPHDTLQVTAAAPYQGTAGTGNAYIYLAPGRTQLLSPVIVVEGFDLDDSMGWDELYALLNQEDLIETLRSRGYDAVVLDFTDATEPLQRNAMVVSELVTQVGALIPGHQTMALAGASMGGLLARYALSWLETQGGGHRVRTYISFDAPHRGADIPLGVQYWVWFFSGQSAEAAFLLSRLDRPGARQMLVYHHTDPPGTTGQADPLRAAFLADLAAVGGFPSQPRTVAIANGSGSMVGQGFAPGAQIVRWDYTSLLVDIRGNVWAVPNGTTTKIFDGRTRILFSTTTQVVNVSGTQPYDNAPGGWRSTMADMDSVAAPYGDIVALHPNHCFIPTVSALDLAVSDLFHPVAGDPALLAKTPFDAVYFPAANQEHVAITAENAAWILAEVEAGVTAVDGAVVPARALRLRGPNPATGSVHLTLTLGRDEAVEVAVYGLDGRAVATLAHGMLGAGSHALAWDGRTGGGRSAPAGVYFVRARMDGRSETLRVVRLHR